MPLLIYALAPLVGIHCTYSLNDAEDFDKALAILKNGKDIEKSVVLLARLYEHNKTDKYRAHLLCAKAALLLEIRDRQLAGLEDKAEIQKIQSALAIEAKSLSEELLAFKKSVAENLEKGREKSGYLNLVSWSLLLVQKAISANPEWGDLQKTLRAEIVVTAKESAESYPQHTQLKESGDIMLSSVEDNSTDYKDLASMLTSSARQRKTINDALALLDIAAPKQADAAAVWLYLGQMRQRAYEPTDKVSDISRFKNAADADNQNAYFALCYAAYTAIGQTPIVALAKMSESERAPLLEYFFKGINLKNVKPVYYAKTCPKFLKRYFPDKIISSPINILFSGSIYTDLCNEYVSKGEFGAAVQLSDTLFDIATQLPGFPTDAKDIRDAAERSIGTPRAFFYTIGLISNKITQAGASIPQSDKMMLCKDIKRVPPQTK